MQQYTLNEKQAYLAMYLFIENLYKLTNDDSLGGFLGSMQLMNDGRPFDPAYWEDWMSAVEKAMQKQN